MPNAENGVGNQTERPAERMLKHLKVQGPTTTAELAQVLQVSVEAARQQLVKLVRQGMIEAERISAGVGRPKQIWTLTAAGHARFPDGHAQLTVQMIRAIDQVFGSQGLQRIVEQRAQQQARDYAARLAGSGNLAERVALLADLRSSEGYMARVERKGADFLLIEDHCPICAAASVCQGFCAAELSQFQALMEGWAEVTREEHLLRQARRCVYRFRPAGI